MRHATASVLVLISTVVMTSWSSAQTPCPTSTMTLPDGCTIATTNAALDTTCPPQPYWTRGRGHFDLDADQLGLALDYRSSPCCGDLSGRVRAADRHRLVGAPAGTPIPLTIRLQTAASIVAGASDFDASATGSGALEVDGVVVAQATQTTVCDGDPLFPICTTTGNVSTVSADLVIEAEQEFTLVAELSGRANGTFAFAAVSMESTIHFDGLPPGVTVVSCHDAPVPVRAASWGTLKTRYR
jgi:hypothetical protein